MGQLRFGTDGVRGHALDELTPDYVRALGRAAAEVLGGGTWVIGRDTRESGPTLETALVDGLCAGGAEPLLAGVIPTPAVALLSDRRRAPAAMITASHNPYHDNGVKIFAPGGLKLTDEVEAAIEAAVERNLAEEDVARPTGCPPMSLLSAIDEYDSAISATVEPNALADLRIVVDVANGATYETAPRVLRELGARVIVTHAEPDGQNINAECGATHPAALVRAVLDCGADMGLAFDGDGDRVIAVDHRGNVVDGDRMIALAALQLRAAGQLTNNAVVVTVMSNIGFHKAMAAAGIDVVTTAVGDRFVLEALDAGDYALGGEQSGHIIYRHLATTGDGLLAGLRLAAQVRASGRLLADLAAEVMTSYPQVLVNVRVAERHPRVAEEIAVEIAAAESRLQGDGRILVRPSGTEPLIRVMVEAATPELAQDTADDLANLVRARWA